MTSGPTIGILPKNLERNGLAPLTAGPITPAALPNIFAANPPTFAKPLNVNPFRLIDLSFDLIFPGAKKGFLSLKDCFSVSETFVIGIYTARFFKFRLRLSCKLIIFILGEPINSATNWFFGEL